MVYHVFEQNELLCPTNSSKMFYKNLLDTAHMPAIRLAFEAITLILECDGTRELLNNSLASLLTGSAMSVTWIILLLQSNVQRNRFTGIKLLAQLQL